MQENGCGVAEIAYSTYADTVSVAGLTAHNQTLGAVTKTTPPNNGTITLFPHDGIVGFSGVAPGDTQLGGVPFFQNLCNQGEVKECRFGLVFRTDGSGLQILGGLDAWLLGDTLEYTPANPSREFSFTGNITIDGRVVSSNQHIIPDSGTANIVAPKSELRKLFAALGMQAVEQNLPGCTSVLFGYYPCDAPPGVGLTFGDDSPWFDIEPSAFQQADNGNNNCTAIITGIDFGREPVWIFEQAWFQGKYVDFDQSGKKLGVARLRGWSH
ncbi:hypothetical protein LTR15_008693 [Elasticomyces elasticus]|nr:hypothetical protein LTR15_008693 [Elasticomyces elasticus]